MPTNLERIAEIEARSVDTAEDIALLSDMVRDAFGRISADDPRHGVVASYLSDGAAVFAADRAVGGGTLACNGATLKSLAVAVRQLEHHSVASEAATT